MNQSGVMIGRNFRDKLVEAIDDDESNDRRTSYYQRWARALEKMSLDNGLVTSTELDARTERYASDVDDGH